ncbi:MAG: uroporphyrinogen decarboxylase family protein [Bacillota bacterium]|nr:uroporphyrinogen decarboxylase family protein [Bacillota bacterium]
MTYNQGILEKIDVYKRLYADERPGQILATISPYTFHFSDSQRANLGLEQRPLDSWHFPDDADAFVDAGIENLRRFTAYTKDLQSDYIPNLSVGLGVALASAFFSDAKIRFSADTSWVHPVIHDWSDLDRLTLSEDHAWYRLLAQMTKRIVSSCAGDYVPGCYAYFGPSDMANALRGNALFYDYHDNPDQVHRLMRISTEAIIWLHEHLLALTGLAAGGSVMADIWLPGPALFMSEDASDLCSADIYRTFSRPYTQRIIDRFGSAYMHHHAVGRHIHDQIATLNNLQVVELSWDPNCPRPIDDIVCYYRMNPSVPLQTRCTAADVYANIDHLMQCRTILMVIVESLEEAKDVLAFIRYHSRI